MQTQTANIPSAHGQSLPSPVQPHVNEAGSINVSGYIRIFDPNSNQTLVEARE